MLLVSSAKRNDKESMTFQEIREQIDSMSLEEIKQRLANYMATDSQVAPRPVEIAVRLSNNVRCRYEVVLVATDGTETLVDFGDRYSRLVYLYTLLHPQGFQRRQAAANDYQVLRQLYTLLYFRDSNALLKTIRSQGFDHFFSHNVAQSRKAIRRATAYAQDFAIDRPQPNGGKTLIPFVCQGGRVLLDDSLRTAMFR
jgi:hypothetical protein